MCTYVIIHFAGAPLPSGYVLFPSEEISFTPKRDTM